MVYVIHAIRRHEKSRKPLVSYRSYKIAAGDVKKYYTAAEKPIIFNTRTGKKVSKIEHFALIKKSKRNTTRRANNLNSAFSGFGMRF